MKRNNSFLLVFSGLLMLGIFLSCDKYVTPSKVERKITKDSWYIDSYMFLDSTITGSFTNKFFGFGEEGQIIILGDNVNKGYWELGLDKKPTVLYISGFSNLPYTTLNDDWEVTTCSDEEISLRSENGAYENRLVLKKHEP